MEENNPYSSLEAPVAAFAAASERAAFLKKVYGILFLGILGFAGTLWAAANVALVNGWAVSMGEMIYGQRWGMFIYMGIFVAGSMAVNAVAMTRPINAIAYGLWSVLLGLLIAPLVLFVVEYKGVEVVSQASGLTALVFGGTTLFVLFTGKDFKWLGGVLFAVMLTLVGVSILGYFMGFSLGLWFSGLVVVVYVGYILYHTSEILHRLPTNMAMSAAILLFTDVVLLFKHILILLASSRD